MVKESLQLDFHPFINPKTFQIGLLILDHLAAVLDHFIYGGVCSFLVMVKQAKFLYLGVQG